MLNPNIEKYMEIVRSEFPDAKINVFTNGILLIQSETWKYGNFWESCKKHNVGILMTVYPINIDLNKINILAKKYDVNIEMFNTVGASLEETGIKYSTFHPLDLNGFMDRHSYISCYQFNECMVLEGGKIYTCPIIPNVRHFNKKFSQNLIVEEEDFIDI